MPDDQDDMPETEEQEPRSDSESGWTPMSREVDLWIDFEFINSQLDATLRRARDRRAAKRLFPAYMGQMGLFHPVGDGGQLHPDTLRVLRMMLQDAQKPRVRRLARHGDHLRATGRIIRAFFRCGLLRLDAENRLWFGRRYEAWTTTPIDVHPTEVN